jgi:hypothetical protein
MQRGFVVIAVLIVGAAAYVIGAASRESHDETAPPRAERASLPLATDERAQSRPVSDRRAEALQRELLESNRALRAAVEALTAALHEREGDARDAAAQQPASTPEQWVARQRAREPEVVLDALCRLRARMLTRALQFDARAASEVGNIVGTLTPDELRAAQRVQEQNVLIHRKWADACRSALGELDAVRTLDDLARWRVRHGEFE